MGDPLKDLQEVIDQPSPVRGETPEEVIEQLDHDGPVFLWIDIQSSYMIPYRSMRDPDNMPRCDWVGDTCPPPNRQRCFVYDPEDN